MKKAYLYCLKKLRKFRKTLISEENQKRGKLYFSWLETKTEMVENEKNDKYIYENIVKKTLPNYKIDQYNYQRLNDKLKKIVDANYIFDGKNYIFSNTNIVLKDAMLISKKILFKRGNVIWVDFGFNVGNEFGGMYPAIILKTFNDELFVVPVSSKKPKEYIKIEKEVEDGKISETECQKKKENVTAIIEINNIYRYRNMIRWTDITRSRKISWLRINFSGTIGKIDGSYINLISKKISEEF